MENIDYNILIGDLGFGNMLPVTEMHQNINSYESARKTDPAKAEKYFTAMLKNDEFNISRPNSDYLQRYQEEKIKFLPTYKYDKYGAIYS